MAFPVCPLAFVLSAAVWGADSYHSFTYVFFDDIIGAGGKDAVPLSTDCLCSADYFSYMEEG